MAQTNISNTCILIQDKNPFYRRTLRSLLYTLGYRDIHDCEDRIAAWTKFRTYTPDIVFLDWCAQDKGIPEFISSLRQRAQDDRKSCGILIATDQANANFAREAKDAGVDGIILKPFSVKVIARYIDKVSLAVAETRAELQRAYDDEFMRSAMPMQSFRPR